MQKPEAMGLFTRFYDDTVGHFTDKTDTAMKMWMVSKETRERCARILEPFVGADKAPRSARYFIALLYIDTQEVLREDDPHDQALRRALDATKATWWGTSMADDPTITGRVRAGLESFQRAYQCWVRRDEKETLRHLICMAVQAPPDSPDDPELTRLLRHIGGERTCALVRMFRDNRNAIFQRIAGDVEHICQRAFYDVMQEDVTAGRFERLFAFLHDVRTRMLSSSGTGLDADHVCDMLDVDYLRMRQHNGTLDADSIRRCFQQVLDLVDTPLDAPVRARLATGNPVSHLVPFAQYVAMRVARMDSK